MASPSILNQGNLRGFRQYGEVDVLNFWSLNGTGKNGMLVAIETGNQSPTNNDGYINGSSVGAAYTNIVSQKYEVIRKVRAATSGDTKANLMGVTLNTVAEYDENSMPLRLTDKNRRDERFFCLSGEAVPVLSRGIITIANEQVVGTPFPGHYAVAYTGGGGKFWAVNPSTLPNTGNGLTTENVVGRFISTSGSAFGGYSQFKLEL